MKKFIKVCVPTLGGEPSCIYRFLNVDQIVFIEFENVIENSKRLFFKSFAYVSSKERFLIIYRSDLVDLVGEDVVKDFEKDELY